MRLQVLLIGSLVVAGLVMSSPLQSHDKSVKHVDNRVDGKTIANLITEYLLGLIPNDSIELLIRMIIVALNKPEFDYWGNVKNEVIAVVGSYINAHNMHQVEIYQKDLQELMQRYSDAPIESSNYADKNLQAAALSTSVISHRYLVETDLKKESMILHFEDIASIHIVILKDVAETYSRENMPPSRWWVDLDEELNHYINYSQQLRTDLHDWRLDQVTCQVHNAGGSCTSWEWAGKICYDTYKAVDAVTGEVSECEQLHGTDSCKTHCDLFKSHKTEELNQFYKLRVDGVLESWKQLKKLSSKMAAKASIFHDPIKRR